MRSKVRSQLLRMKLHCLTSKKFTNYFSRHMKKFSTNTLSSLFTNIGWLKSPMTSILPTRKQQIPNILNKPMIRYSLQKKRTFQCFINHQKVFNCERWSRLWVVLVGIVLVSVHDISNTKTGNIYLSEVLTAQEL